MVRPPSMQFKSLKVFCDVVRLRSFSRAADENEISQSAASQMVHHLEERLGVKLIDRSKRPFVLTPEGDVYYDGCKVLVERYLALEDRIRALQGHVAGRVRVASIYSVGLHHMADYLHKFLARYPKANVRLEYLHPNRVYRSVENDTADLGLVSYPKSSRRIKAIPWREEPMVLVCSPRHWLADRKTIELEELAGEKMVGFTDGLSIRREIDKALSQRRVEIEMAMEFDNIETIKRAIEIDAGIALLPEPTVGREVDAGLLRKIPLATRDLVRPLGIVHRRGKELSNTARCFIELLQSEAHPHGAPSGKRSSASTAALEAAAKAEPPDDDVEIEPASARDSIPALAGQTAGHSAEA
ncbi:MAG TPA: LysR family transcriptional regulator [Pirellulales bacterium]